MDVRVRWTTADGAARQRGGTDIAPPSERVDVSVLATCCNEQWQSLKDFSAGGCNTTLGTRHCGVKTGMRQTASCQETDNAPVGALESQVDMALMAVAVAVRQSGHQLTVSTDGGHSCSADWHSVMKDSKKMIASSLSTPAKRVCFGG